MDADDAGAEQYERERERADERKHRFARDSWNEPVYGDEDEYPHEVDR